MTRSAMRLADRFARPLITLPLAFLAGVALVAAFAPLNWAWLAFPCIAILFALNLDVTPRVAFWRGLAFGYGLYGVGVSWVYVSLHVYGGMPLWMGGLAVFLFAGLLALFVAIPSALAARMGGSPLARMLTLGSLLLIFEWGKSWVFTGFPWLDIGYSQTTTWLFAWAPIGGVYLVSFVVLSGAGLLLSLVVFERKGMVAGALAVVAAASYGAGQIVWSEPTGDVLQIGLVQPNTPIERKWQPQFRDRTISHLAEQSHQLIQQVRGEGEEIDLIVWPETALALYYQQTDKDFWRALAPPQTALLTGIVDSPETERVYNAAVLSCGDEQHIYRKRHLVPFGEYMPMRFLFDWLLDYLQLPMSDFSSWQPVQSLQCGEQLNIGLSICYEDAFANEMRIFGGDASILVNISEDAWFGDSLAPHQRLQMAQMRAREVSRPLVRSGNSGPSGFINHLGEVERISGKFVTASLAHSVQPQRGKTFYKRFGDWIIWLCIAALVLRLSAVVRARV